LHTRCKGRIPQSGGSILLPLRRQITPIQPSYPVFPVHAGRAGCSPHSTGRPQLSGSAAPIGVPASAGLSIAEKSGSPLRDARRTYPKDTPCHPGDGERCGAVAARSFSRAGASTTINDIDPRFCARRSRRSTGQAHQRQSTTSTAVGTVLRAGQPTQARSAGVEAFPRAVNAVITHCQSNAALDGRTPSRPRRLSGWPCRSRPNAKHNHVRQT